MVSKKTLARALVGFGAAATAVVVMAGPAAASVDDSFSVGTGDGCAVINFVDYGYYPPTGSNNDDFFVVHDYCADGYGVTGFAALNGGYVYSAHNSNGQKGAPVYFDPFGNVVAGDLVEIQVCLTTSGKCVKVSSYASRTSYDG